MWGTDVIWVIILRFLHHRVQQWVDLLSGLLNHLTSRLYFSLTFVVTVNSWAWVNDDRIFCICVNYRCAINAQMICGEGSRSTLSPAHRSWFSHSDWVSRCRGFRGNSCPFVELRHRVPAARFDWLLVKMWNGCWVEEHLQEPPTVSLSLSVLMIQKHGRFVLARERDGHYNG